MERRLITYRSQFHNRNLVNLKEKLPETTGVVTRNESKQVPAHTLRNFSKIDTVR